MNLFQSALPTVITIVIYTTFLQHAQSRSATPNARNAPNTKYSTIIMGAGMSGISAAKRLYDSGDRNFIVLEAQDYIGGRTKTVEFGGLSGVNVGASWFTGGCYDSSQRDCAYESGSGPTEINPLFTLARQNGYSVMDTNTKWNDLIALGRNGRDETDQYRTADDAFGVVRQCISNMRSAHSISLSEALYQCGWDSTNSASSKSVEWKYLVWMNAISTDSVSADVLTLRSKELYGDQDLFVTDSRGFQGITKLVATDFIDKIRLNAPIKTVAYDANEGVTVTLENGEMLSSNYGIITFSLGVLQSNLVTFSPPVPSWKSNAWNQFGMGHFSPILIKWPYDFWTATTGTKWWFVLNDDRFGYYIFVMNLHHRDLYKNSLVWRIDVTADVSIQIQRQNLARIQSDIVTKLKRYFDNVPQPEEIFIQKWSENKYIRGSYMYWPPQSTSSAQREVTRNIDGVLHFAGEHTVSDNGYVHSAYFSGINAADEVLQSMRSYSSSTSSYGRSTGSYSSDATCIKVGALSSRLREFQGTYSKDGSKYRKDGGGWGRTIQKKTWNGDEYWTFSNNWSYGECSQSDITECSGQWVYNDVNMGSFRKTSSCNAAFNMPECFDDYDNAMCFYFGADNGTSSEVIEPDMFAVLEEEGCVNGAPVFSYADDLSDAIYHIYKSDLGPWYLTDGPITNDPVALCEEEDLSDCGEEKWMEEGVVLEGAMMTTCGMAKEERRSVDPWLIVSCVLLVFVTVFMVWMCLYRKKHHKKGQFEIRDESGEI
eukprot:18532_1